jgi:hypothetical protein
MAGARMAESDQGTEYHEAGHIVVALYHGRIPIRASALRRGDTAGLVEFERDVPEGFNRYFGRSPEKLRYLEMRVRITLAGTIVHDIAEPGRQHDVGDHADARFAHELFKDHWECSDEERATHVVRLEAETRAIVVQHWEIVERIARELLCRRELSGADLAAIFQGAGAP